MHDSIEERVGRRAHERWKGWIVESGYADHAWSPHPGIYKDICSHAHCYMAPHLRLPESKHHPDMVPWEELSEVKRGKYIETGMGGYGLAAELLAELRTASDDFIHAVESACQYKEAVYYGFAAVRNNDVGIIGAHTAPASVARHLIQLRALLDLGESSISGAYHALPIVRADHAS